MDVWVEADDYNRILSYARNNGLKNPSQAIQQILTEWRRFMAIIEKHEAKQNLEHAEQLKQATVIKE